MTATYYTAGVKLLTIVSGLEDDLKHNYEKGDIHQRALANIGGLQGDLFASYLILLGEDEKGPLVGRSVILRSILENQGSILHIKGSYIRAKSYLDHATKMHEQIKNNLKDIKTPEEDLVWSKSKIKHRVSLIDDSATRLYDTLSNFAHGNNVQYFYDTKELTEAYIKAIDSYFVGLFIGYLTELGVGLDLSAQKRKLIFDGIKEVGEAKAKESKSK